MDPSYQDTSPVWRPRFRNIFHRNYGNNLDGIETDYWDILNYFGKDFIEVKRRPLAFYQNSHEENFGESQGFQKPNQLVLLNKMAER